ncbi:gamma-glutamyltransferase [Mariprofundus ferrooxydans]|nr:gamma-glutamyltransferase [Mariprofundus ferrooxydans]
MLKKYILASLFIIPSLAHAAQPPASMVVSAHPLATKAGIQILKQGGNAFDAAAAAALALGVVEPGSSGIGGGGFFLLYIAKEDRYVMIDARETSPELAGNGEVYNTQSSINGAQSAGVPGLLAGVDHLISTYGRIAREKTVSPAISLASKGFPISPHLQSMITWRKDALNDAAQRIFLNHGDVPEEHSLLRQTALADTLRRFAKHGAKDFYRGETAGRLVADMKRDGGLIRESDLANYKVIERQPVQFTYHDTQFISAALPSSGGITMAEIFGILQNDNLKEMDKADRTHLLIEAMKRAYKDRNQYLGDGDFVSIPDLLNPQRLKKLRTSIDMHKATPSNALLGFAEPIGASVDTTHFSIIDDEGNMVSATLSINYGMGSGYVSPSTGILLNDEMDDFATRPGKPNAYGLVQGKANAVAPRKRMLSSMSPTFVIDKNRTLIVGTPGGSRIISMVMLAAVHFIAHDKPSEQWVNAPRFHHQFLPDMVQYEAGAFSPALIDELKKRGHHLKQMNRSYGNMQAILWNRTANTLTGISDARGEGNAMEIQR